MFMSLPIYRRHRSKCKFKSDRSSKKCRCSLWLAGTLFGKPAAEKEKRNLEDGKSPEQSITIKAALDAFIKDCERRNLSRNTLRKYRTLESSINDFGEDHGLVLFEILRAIGIFPRELLERNSATSARSSRSASKTTGSPRTRPSLSKHRRQM